MRQTARCDKSKALREEIPTLSYTHKKTLRKVIPTLSYIPNARMADEHVDDLLLVY